MEQEEQQTIIDIVNNSTSVANGIIELKQKKAYYANVVAQIEIDRENAATQAASANADAWIAYYEDLQKKVDEALDLMEQLEEKERKKKVKIFGGVAVLSLGLLATIAIIMRD